MINTKDGSCKSFAGAGQAALYSHSVCLDPVFDVLWRCVRVRSRVLRSRARPRVLCGPNVRE